MLIVDFFEVLYLTDYRFYMKGEQINSNQATGFKSKIVFLTETEFITEKATNALNHSILLAVTNYQASVLW